MTVLYGAQHVDCGHVCAVAQSRDRVEAVTGGLHSVGQHAVPDDWWIADRGSGPAVWEPEPAGPRRVIAEDLAGWRLWGVLARVLPDRGTCTTCTADVCSDHREGNDLR